MKALVYGGPGQKALTEVPKPTLPQQPGDALVRITHTTICGTDLHILKGDVPTCLPTCLPGTTLGHEGVGMYSHCTTGGWILGKTPSTAPRPSTCASRTPTPACTPSRRRPARRRW